MSQGSKQSCRFFASCHALSTCMAQGLPQSCKFCQLSRSLYMHGTVFITVLQALPVAMFPLRACYKVYSSLPGFARCHPLSPHARYGVYNSPADIASLPCSFFMHVTGSKQSCRFCQLSCHLHMHVTGFKTVLRRFTSCHALSTFMAQSLQQSCRFCQLPCSVYSHGTRFRNALQWALMFWLLLYKWWRQ